MKLAPDYGEELYYDKAGNRTRRIAGGVEEQYLYDARNRLTSHTKQGQATRYAYDHAGNLVDDGEKKYSYDGFNRATKIETRDGQVQVNRYDAEGLRYEMEENGRLVKFIFNENKEVVVEETDQDLKRLIRSFDLWASECTHEKTWYHYASDEQGSIVFVADEEEVKNRYEYDAWGNAVVCEEQVENRFRYTGQQYDTVTQQYYLRARYYNPVIARFTQEDEYRGDGLNLYAYCANNPVTYVDPSGYGCEGKDAVGKGKTAGGDNADRVYVPNPKHDTPSGKISPNPFGNDAVEGQKSLKTAYSSSKTKQLYNVNEGKLVKFQPDNVGGYHPYEVINPAQEVPIDVLRRMKKEGLISKNQYNKWIKNQ